MNKDIWDTFFALGLGEVLMHLHGMSTAPATHNKGCLPIDGIYVSQHLGEVAKGGILLLAKVSWAITEGYG